MHHREREFLTKFHAGEREKANAAKEMLRRQRQLNLIAMTDPATPGGPIPYGDEHPMAFWPRKWAVTLEENQKLNLCCRHTETHTGRLYRSKPTEEHPDIFIAVCGSCGRRHHRLFVSPDKGVMGTPMHTPVGVVFDPLTPPVKV